MQFVIDNWALFLVAIGSGAMLLVPVLRGGGAGALSPAGAVQRINREKAVVIDVSSPEEYAAGHVTNARNIPLDRLEAELPGAVKNKALPLVLVCASGARARRAEAVARKLGYEQAQALAGGLKAWKEANLPVASLGKA